MSSGTSQELARFKNLVGSWEKVARRHPYSVFNGDRSAEYDEARKEDPFTTHFGEGLPVRGTPAPLTGFFFDLPSWAMMVSRALLACALAALPFVAPQLER